MIATELQTLIKKFEESSSNQANLIVRELSSLKQETTSLMEQQLKSVNPVVINGQAQSQSSEYHVISQPLLRAVL